MPNSKKRAVASVGKSAALRAVEASFDAGDRASAPCRSSRTADAEHVVAGLRKHAAARDDQGRISTLYGEYADNLASALRKAYGSGPPDPRDIAQLAFQKVMERGDIADIRDLKAFVWRTARNLIFKDHRAREVRAKYDFEIDCIFYPLNTDDLTPERVLLAKEQLATVNRVLSSMSLKRRRAFLLHRLEQISVSEVAHRLGLSRSTATEHITKAATEIQAALTDD